MFEQGKWILVLKYATQWKCSRRRSVLEKAHSSQAHDLSLLSFDDCSPRSH